MIIDEEDYLAHYGILRKSGRYPWGSGEDAAQRGNTFIGMLQDLRDKGLTDVEIARGFSTPDHPFTTSQLRETNTIARNAKKQSDIATAQKFRDKGMSNVAIGKRMGIPEPTVRALLKPGEDYKNSILQSTSNMLRKQVDEKGYIDIGVGVEHYLDISKEKLQTAVALLKDEGYSVVKVQIDQLGTNNKTIVKVLAPPGTTYREVAMNKDKIKQIAEYSVDGGLTYVPIKPPMNIDSKRVGVRYAEQGGTDADGVIYVRPGVDDVSLGGGHYAQVRVAVDGSHYIKGMAVYKDDLPDGVDLMFNTNKKNTGNKLDALKPMQADKEGNIDKENPFGATIRRQITTPDGKTVKSVMNLVNEEGDWDQWSRSLPSQMLSKQSPQLARAQLDMTYEKKRNELESIVALTNPGVKKKLLESFADDADSSSIHLKAASLPRQGTHVILPINSMKDTEVYAPNFDNGERVVLIRFPHGGTFEIPELTVNNRHPEAKKILGQAKDAIGINSKVAERLSGADFDGDTVLVIPNNSGRIKSTPALKGLMQFDAKAKYRLPDDAPRMSDRAKGIQMGLVSNLITDMTIRGATNDELARAVRHSMVVIDAQKHHLDYKRSAVENGISSLMLKYQDRKQGGAATLISNSGANAKTAVPERKSTYRIDPQTGEKNFVTTGDSYVLRTTSKRTGVVKEKTVVKTTMVPKLAAVKDAHELSSGTVIEKVYADHSNRLKMLANAARKELVNTKTNPSSPAAKTAYSNEVASLNAKLNLALRNAPLERQAQILGNAVVSQKLKDYEDLDESEIKKIKSQALKAMRERTGAKRHLIDITDREWEAIQAGAISNEKLSKILDNTDIERVKQLATPRSNTAMSSTKILRAKQMLADGYTQADVAKQLGVPMTLLKSQLNDTNK